MADSYTNIFKILLLVSHVTLTGSRKVNPRFLKVNFFELAVYETIFLKRNVSLTNTALDDQHSQYHSLKYTNYNIS